MTQYITDLRSSFTRRLRLFATLMIILSTGIGTYVTHLASSEAAREQLVLEVDIYQLSTIEHVEQLMNNFSRLAPTKKIIEYDIAHQDKSPLVPLCYLTIVLGLVTFVFKGIGLFIDTRSFFVNDKTLIKVSRSEDYSI